MKEFGQTILVALLLLGLPGQAPAAEGWLLLLPPVDQAKLQSESTGASTYPIRAFVEASAGAFLLPVAPLGQWEQLRAFDSAAACEAWRTGLEEDAERHFQAAAPQDYGPSISLEELLIFIRYSQAMESRCLPVSAVYALKP